jgi:uridine phosphorylase
MGSSVVFGRLEQIRAVRFSRVAEAFVGRHPRAKVAAVPARLRPKTPLAGDAILVGDPGRSLLLAQELLDEPKMSNHARGLWGYTGRGVTGDELTIQATGMGGPSAALVLADLAKLGVERVVRVGTCAALGEGARLGELLIPAEAVAASGSATSFGLAAGERAHPEMTLLDLLRKELGSDARAVAVTSLDTMPAIHSGLPDIAAADMQTVAVLAHGRELGIAAAAVLIVSEAGEGILADEELESTAKRAGQAAAKALAKPKVEG